MQLPSTQTDRYYAADNYLLPSDEAERTRLQLQHEMIKKQFTSELLPPQLSLKAGNRVLDAGTGTGVWALDVAKSADRGVTVVGVDIEPRLFPIPLPNTVFEVQSTLALPAEWTSTFACAHQRLLIAAFSLENWKKCFAEMYRVLEPGGYLRMEEIDMLRTDATDMPPEPPFTTQFRKAIWGLCEKRGVGAEHLPTFAELLKEAGFVDVNVMSRYVPVGPGEVGKEARRACVGAWRGMKTPMVRSGGCGIAQTPEEFDRFMDRVEREWETNDHGRKFFQWTARKPVT